MPRYFFHLCDDDDAFPDTEGMNFTNEEAAKREAYAGALEIVAEAIRAKRPLANSRLEVMDEDGGLIAIYQFRDLARF